MNEKPKILITDDSEINRALLKEILGDGYDYLEAEDGAAAVELMRQRTDISLLLLDLMMPGMDGFDVLRVMKYHAWLDEIPVIVISAAEDTANIERAYDLGVADYIRRPFERIMIIRRVKNILMLYAKQKRLTRLVTDQVYEKEHNSVLMISILSHVVEFRNSESGLHVLHIRTLTDLLLHRLAQKTDRYQLDESDIARISTASALHDIGKIVIPEEILNKPGRLTAEEFAIIKNHTVIGAEILKNVTLIDHVVEVARNHHERYDGHGYPDGLKGRAIPLHARIVALADSYDAMRSKRIYCNALPQQTIYEEIKKNRGTKFDPELTDIFLRLLDENRMVIPINVHNMDTSQIIPDVETEIGKFISDVIKNIKSQEDSDNFDFLTGLPVRNIGEKLTAQFMQEHSGCLAFMDMDNLKQINDIYGHKAGDRALKSLGNLLAEYAQNAAVCRLGGDEFLLFIPNITREAMIKQMEEIFAKFRAM